MTLVGTQVREASAPISLAIPTATDPLFLAIMSERGPIDSYMYARNMAEAVSKLGKRATYSNWYDYLDFYFRQGGSRAYLGRYVGPAAVKATVTITDAVAGIVWTATAVGPGDWYNGLNVQVVVGTGTERSIVITHDVDTDVQENSGIWNTNAELQAWAANSQYIRLVPGASVLQPNAQTKNMGATVAGTDDRANVSDATAKAALDLFIKDLGPGQVAYSQRTSAVAQGQLLDHGALNNRDALPDPADGLTDTGALAAAAALRSHVNAKRGFMAWPWIDMDGLTPFTFRAIPPSAAVAALLARNDSSGVSIGQAPAGDYGILDQARQVHASVATDAQREALNEGSVNFIINKGGTIKLYGFRTLVNPLTNPTWKQGTSIRTYMAVSAQSDAIAEHYVMRQIDGQFIVFKQLQGELLNMLGDFYLDGALYGATFPDAASVDVDSVNTPASIAAGEIHAKEMIVVSPTGEAVIIDIFKQQISGS